MCRWFLAGRIACATRYCRRLGCDSYRLKSGVSHETVSSAARHRSHSSTHNSCDGPVPNGYAFQACSFNHSDISPCL